MATTDVLSQNFASRRKSYILSLPFPDITHALPSLTRMCYACDVLELRVDLLTPSNTAACEGNIPTREYVATQLELLQQHTDLPILFTVRTASQGGKFPNDAHEQALDLMLLGLAYGCDYIDVEISWPTVVLEEIASKKGDKKLVASFHDWTGQLPWTSIKHVQQYMRACSFGGECCELLVVAKALAHSLCLADLIKLSLIASSIYDCHELALLVREHQAKSAKPLIAVAMGAQGQLSRATSPISFVTHELAPVSAGPGQMSLVQIHKILHMIGQLPKRNFYIFGDKIAHSLSPILHNAAFKELGLPHRYRIHETESVDEGIRELMEKPEFGGASVTSPHKLQIGKYLQSLSKSAKLVGAVNTVVVREDEAGSRTLIGDNTDWLGIKSCIESGLRSGARPKVAIVLGAGGAARAACFAIQELGVRHVFLVNRSRDKAERVAKDFLGVTFEIIQTLKDLPRFVSVVPTIIVACVPADDFTEDDIPAHIFEAASFGVLVEMAYHPLVTALMGVAGRYPGWKVLRGTDVLKEQAYHQFRIWTGRRAPVSVMAAALEAHSSD
jgi:pentafunctional AROM polypeptide